MRSMHAVMGRYGHWMSCARYTMVTLIKTAGTYPDMCTFQSVNPHTATPTATTTP
jgi:hypothetical protein